jgi:hypothetical protein
MLGKNIRKAKEQQKAHRLWQCFVAVCSQRGLGMMQKTIQIERLFD